MPTGRWLHSGCPGPTRGLWLVGYSTPAQQMPPMEFMPHSDASSWKDFWAMWQENTLTLAWAPQACTKKSVAPQVFSAIHHENFKCAWPPWWLSVGWHSWGLPLKTNRRRAWNPPHTRGGHHPPRWGNWTTSDSRFSPRMMQNPKVCRTHWAKHCS